MDQMSDQAQQILENIKTGIEKVPEGKLDYLMGFAEGLAAMAETKEQKADAS